MLVVVVVGVATGNRNGSALNVSIECLMVFKFERFFEMFAIVFSFGSC